MTPYIEDHQQYFKSGATATPQPVVQHTVQANLTDQDLAQNPQIVDLVFNLNTTVIHTMWPNLAHSMRISDARMISVRSQHHNNCCTVTMLFEIPQQYYSAWLLAQ